MFHRKSERCFAAFSVFVALCSVLFISLFVCCSGSWVYGTRKSIKPSEFSWKNNQPSHAIKTTKASVMSTRLSQRHYQPARRDEGPRTITSPTLILLKQISAGKREACLLCVYVCVCLGARVHGQAFKRALNKRISDGPIFRWISQTKQKAIKFLRISLIPSRWWCGGSHYFSPPSDVS